MSLTPYVNHRAGVWHGDCLTLLRALGDNTIDAVVTDPPYGLGFMGKAWDALPPGDEWAAECLRVLKPGGHLLAFGGTRTWHRLAVAVEDAGFEMRDSIAWLYGSGFPKSLDVSKAIDKAAGATREVTGTIRTRDLSRHGGEIKGDVLVGVSRGSAEVPITAPATETAREWEGWGTALKPAFEPVVVARKPLAGTVAANVLAHGTGALNIDGCRVGATGGTTSSGEPNRLNQVYGDGMGGLKAEPLNAGRWPANVVLDESQATELDQQSGLGRSRIGKPRGAESGEGWGMTANPQRGVDKGGASRFFYVAKAPKNERPVVDGVAHPTVKPLALMRWLVRLVTPPNGLVLDTFAGSGTTGEACIQEGLRCLLSEREAEYLPLIAVRLTRASGPDMGPVVDSRAG